MLEKKAVLMVALQKNQARSEANLQLASKLENAIGACWSRDSRRSKI